MLIEIDLQIVGHLGMKKYKGSAAERAYFRKKAREWRSRNPEEARKRSREAQKKYREKMKTKGYEIRLIKGEWKWVPKRAPKKVKVEVECERIECANNDGKRCTADIKIGEEWRRTEIIADKTCLTYKRRERRRGPIFTK